MITKEIIESYGFKQYPEYTYGEAWWNGQHKIGELFYLPETNDDVTDDCGRVKGLTVVTLNLFFWEEFTEINNITLREDGNVTSAYCEGGCSGGGPFYITTEDEFVTLLNIMRVPYRKIDK